MTYLTSYTKVDIEMSPSAFIEHCSNDEIKELIDELISEGYLEKDEIPLSHPNLIELEFYKNISKIKTNRLSLTNEEDEILRKIALRF